MPDEEIYMARAELKENRDRVAHMVKKIAELSMLVDAYATALDRLDPGDGMMVEPGSVKVRRQLGLSID